MGGNISAVGNIAGTYFLGNGSQLSGLSATYGDANVVTLLSAFGSNAISTSGNITGNTAGFAIGYLNVPQVLFTANATLGSTAAGKHYYSTLGTASTLTISNNSSVAWAVGTAISVVNRGTGNITVAQGSGVNLYLAGNVSAGNRIMTSYGMATLLNVSANIWMINGSGVV